MQLSEFERYVNRQADGLEELDRRQMVRDEKDRLEGEFYDALVYIREHLMHMTDPQKRTK